MRTRHNFLTAVMAVIVLGYVQTALGQPSVTADQCTAYDAIIRGGASGSVPVVPSAMLTNLDIALPCLARALENINGNVQLPVFKTEFRSQFLSTTGALRSIISAAITADEQASKKNPEAGSG